MTHLLKAAAAAALVSCIASYALAQTTPAPAAKTEVQKSQANDGQSGGVATTPKGTAGPVTTQEDSKKSKDKSKMDDQSSGGVPDKTGAAVGAGSGTPQPGKGPNPTGMTKEKQKSEADSSGEGGKKQ